MPLMEWGLTSDERELLLADASIIVSRRKKEIAFLDKERALLRIDTKRLSGLFGRLAVRLR